MLVMQAQRIQSWLRSLQRVQSDQLDFHTPSPATAQPYRVVIDGLRHVFSLPPEIIRLSLCSQYDCQIDGSAAVVRVCFTTSDNSW